MKKTIIAGVLLLGSLVGRAEAAESLPAGTTTFDTVDGVTVVASSNGIENTKIRIEGILLGESAAREFEIRFGSNSVVAHEASERCLKFLLFAQTHPGRYQIVLEAGSSVGSSVTSCKLKSR